MPYYPHARPRGFAPWRPSEHSEAIVNATLHVLKAEQDYLPLTIRQVFYRLVGRYGYPKTEKASAALCEKITRARRAGLIPFEVIRDDGDTVSHNDGFYDIASFLRHVRSTAANFSIDPSRGQTCVVELHVEAAGMVPQVASWANPLGVPVYSAGGFNSVTSQHALAKRCAMRSKPTVVLSIGDLDPSGISLYWAWRENVLAFHRQGTQVLDADDPRLTAGNTRLGVTLGGYEKKTPPLFRRIGVTAPQAREHGFLTAPPKKTDRRGNFTGATVQAEAIPSALLRDIVREAIFEHYSARVVEELDLLSAEVADELQHAVKALNVNDIRELAAPTLWRLDDEAESILFDDPDAWKAGHTNDDENDMEEGV